MASGITVVVGLEKGWALKFPRLAGIVFLLLAMLPGRLSPVIITRIRPVRPAKGEQLRYRVMIRPTFKPKEGDRALAGFYRRIEETATNDPDPWF